VPFHLTARLQGQQPLFVGLEGVVAQLIQQCAERADGELLGYAVMPNHIHTVYVQGTAGLAAYMQPLLTRVSWLMRQRRGVQGHVFERRYRDTACISADQLRNTIAYVHLNPVRAGLCKGVGDYPWTTHLAVCSASETPVRDCLTQGRFRALRMFAPSVEAPPEQWAGLYHSFLAWRVAMDRHIASGAYGRGEVGPRSPDAMGGDTFWDRCYGPACEPLACRGAASRPKPDLRDFMLQLLRDLDPAMPLEVLRSGGRGKALVRVRTKVIVGARERGYSALSIAMFLRLSSTSVSKHIRSYQP
jgi:REP element-mobilizing transposase RayT